MSKLVICTECGAIGIGEEFIGKECSQCSNKLVELTARTLLISKATIYGYKIFDVGDECPNCHGHKVQRMVSVDNGPSRVCKDCNASWRMEPKNE